MARTRRNILSQQWTNIAAAVMVAGAVFAIIALLERPQSASAAILNAGPQATNTEPNAPDCPRLKAAYLDAHGLQAELDIQAKDLTRAARRDLDDDKAEAAAKEARRQRQRAEKLKSEIERRARRGDCPLPSAQDLAEMLASEAPEGLPPSEREP
jgi:flagellar biosynthesis/type III secretory pathway M-ring protein FliF/YscJ